MGSFKLVAIFVAVVALSEAKVLSVKNSRSTPIVLNVGGSETTILAGAVTPVIVQDDFSGEISAIPSGAEVTDGPKTKIQLNLGSVDTYVVSVVDGFNVGAKIVPNGATACSASLCLAKLNSICPVANQVTNSLGEVVACQNDVLVMSKVCPSAQVIEGDVTTVQSCSTATSYTIVIN